MEDKTFEAKYLEFSLIEWILAVKEVLKVVKGVPLTILEVIFVFLLGDKYISKDEFESSGFGIVIKKVFTSFVKTIKATVSIAFNSPINLSS